MAGIILPLHQAILIKAAATTTSRDPNIIQDTIRGHLLLKGLTDHTHQGTEPHPLPLLVSIPL
jgi:hypothetical protein